MKVTLHITNGDATTVALQKSSINGEIITWREMLCEGKTLTEVGSEDFWKTRFDYLQTSYKLTKKKFIDFTLKEYRNLCQQKQQDEIILWFSDNLHDQINLLAIINWLKKHRNGRQISLIDTNKKLNPNNLNLYLNKKLILTKDDIEYADYIWQLYCSDCPLRLETAHQFNTNSPFANLEKTIKNHLLRFPSIENGLNLIENKILATTENNIFNTKQELINHLIVNEEPYGFSEIQYKTKIADLKKLFTTSFNPVKISKLGKQVLENQVNYYGKIRSELAYLGGAKKYSYLYLSSDDKLLKITS